MHRLAPLLAAGIAAGVGALLSLWFHVWGALALIVVGSIGVGWYRVQVARSAQAEEFFGGAGEETRLTGLQGGSPSEMPLDPQPRDGTHAP
jgi:hypothetical protein